MAIGKRKGKVVKGAGQPGAPGGDNIGGSLSKNDHWYLQQGFGFNADDGSSPQGIVASGGVVSEYTSPPGAVYRCHSFVASGSFVVASLGTGAANNDLEYVVVAGGGGGGGDRGGGGGAGGYRSSVTGESTGGGGSLESALTAVVATYPVVIGAGGFGGAYKNPAPDPNAVGSDGTNTVLTHPTGTITSTGGGGAGAGCGSGPGGVNGRPGGSGGGATGATGQPDRTGGSGTANQGYAGANSPASPYGGGGGGGAGSVGKAVTESPSMQGGSGIDSSITGYPLIRGAGGGGSSGGNFANGGSPTPLHPGGIGGPGGDTTGQGRGFDPTSTGYAANGVFSTGSGGGGSGNGGPSYIGGQGASGFVAIRYQMPGASASAKATGGDISFYGGKVIHTFLTSGTFVTPGSFSETCEYVVIGGGGGTANTNGGGGAGAYRTATMPIGNSVTCPVTIGYGGNGQPKTNYSTNPTGTRGFTGGTTTFAHPTTPIVSPGGGYGSGGHPSNPWSPGGAGGSGGGGSDWAGGGKPGGTGSGDPFPGTIGATPANGWGNDGGAGSGSDAGAGAGGGAGGNGTNGTTTYGGQGGLGIQLPTTFRSAEIGAGYPGPTSPTVTGADDSGLYYVAGGGGGGGYSGGPYTTLKGGGGGGRPNPTTNGTNGWAGAASGGGYPPATPTNTAGNNAQAGSGSGGGAGVSPNGPPALHTGGNGGSGIVMIAYPQ